MTMMTMKWWQRLIKTRGFRHGLPFMILVIGGSFGLREFTQLRYQYNDPTMLEEQKILTEAGFKGRSNKEVLQSELRKLEEADLDNWENIRISRPWEEEEEKKK